MLFRNHLVECTHFTIPKLDLSAWRQSPTHFSTTPPTTTTTLTSSSKKPMVPITMSPSQCLKSRIYSSQFLDLTFFLQVLFFFFSPKDNMPLKRCRRQTDCDRGKRDPKYRCQRFGYEKYCVPDRCFRNSDCINIGQIPSQSVLYSKGCRRRICRYRKENMYWRNDNKKSGR